MLGSFERGLSIGSYLSQYLCNLYMSILYHEIKENMCRTRKGKRGNKRVNLVRHCLIYMDDILLIGPRKRDLEGWRSNLIIKSGRLMETALTCLDLKSTEHIQRLEGELFSVSDGPSTGQESA